MSDTLDADLVVASDIHLKHVGDERGRILLDVLARLGKVECFVLNGDIFDFCLGDSKYFQKKFRPLGDALEAVASRGTRVVFIEGNHEFHMTAIGWRGVEFVTQRDFHVRLPEKKSVKISHGDLIKDDFWYRAFRGLVKSQFARYCARLIPGSWLDAYSLKHASVSRAQDKYRKLDHARILHAFNRWLDEGSSDHGIIGHFHVPYAEKREVHDGLMLSVDSWDMPNLLVYKGTRFQRVFLRSLGAPFQLEAIESVFKTK